MAETDVFERRLRAALVRHTDGGPNDFDALGFARLVAEKEPRRHGLGSVLGWRRAGVPRVAWVLLLVGLLAALAVGSLAVGSQLHRKAPAVVPPVDQVYECPPGSTPDEPGPIDQARPEQPSTMAFDRRAGRLVALAPPDWNGYIFETWTFDVCTNTWTRMHPNQEPPGLSADGQLVYDVDSDVTILVASGKVWAYDLQTNTWTEQGVVPTGATLLAFDPLSGQVVAATGAAEEAEHIDLWNYDVDTDTWAPIRQTNRWRSLDFSAYAYDASADRIIQFAAGAPYEVWLLDIRTGDWSKSGAQAPDFETGLWGVLPAMAYDEAAQRTVLLGWGRSAAYEATADRWETLFEASTAEDQPGACGTRAECRQMRSMVYDPVNQRLVAYGGSFQTNDDWGGSDWVSSDDVLAFDTRTGEWTVLLAPTPGQPAP